jgi:hypothetical protein
MPAARLGAARISAHSEGIEPMPSADPVPGVARHDHPGGMAAMTVRRGTLYVGVFLLAAGAVALGAAAGALDRSAVTSAAGVLWPIAVIAFGVGLVLRHSSAALVGAVLAAAMPGLALGASVVAAPGLSAPCTNAAGPTGPAEARGGTFGSTAAVDLSLSCGELEVTAQPGTDWRLDAHDGVNRSTSVEADATRLSAQTDLGSGHWDLETGRAAWDVALPTGTTIDLSTTLNAGRGHMALEGTRLGVLDLTVNAADLHADLAGAAVDSLALQLNAGSAGIVLPRSTFTGDIHVNAGSLDLCVPDQLGLRVRSTVTLGSIDVNGLVRRGSAWETPGYDAAPFKADLAINARVGSVTINPEGGCK